MTTRRADDAYFTPVDLAFAICSKLFLWIDDEPSGAGPEGVQVVMDPHAGGGAFLRVAPEVFPWAEIVGSDINPRSEEIAQADWLDDYAEVSLAMENYATEHPTLIVGNPPYNEAQKHIEAALDRLRRAYGGPHYVAFLLRIGFLGGLSRARGFWQQNPPIWVWSVAPRPSFTEDGKTDGSEYAVIVWKVDQGKVVRRSTQFDWLMWDRPSRRRAVPTG